MKLSHRCLAPRGEPLSRGISPGSGKPARVPITFIASASRNLGKGSVCSRNYGTESEQREMCVCVCVCVCVSVWGSLETIYISITHTQTMVTHTHTDTHTHTHAHTHT